MKRLVLTILCVLVATSFALADWDVGDPYKMHYPQLPDPMGLDVNFISPKVLADDWLCTESGLVSDIHFWFSSRYDEQFVIDNIHVSIHDDDRTGFYSKPGNLLWEYDFSPQEFRVREYGFGDQGWYDPNTGELIEFDHMLIWQANIVKIPEPFYQKEGTIYWLDLSVKATSPDGTEPAQLGWKTSLDYFEDVPVWADVDAGAVPEWQELIPPTVYLPDLAFVITPEPATILLFLAGVVSLVRRRK